MLKRVQQMTCVAGLFFGVVAGASACRTGRGASTESAAAVTGQEAPTVVTWRAPAAPLQLCQAQSEAGLKVADAYVMGLARDLMAKNPATFHGEYAPERFCVNATSLGRLGSSANVRNRQVMIHTESLRQARNDAEVAMVIARQLARVTLQEPSGPPVELTAYEGWLAAKQRLISVQSEVPGNIKRLTATRRQLMKRRGDLEKNLEQTLPAPLVMSRTNLTKEYRDLVAQVAAYGLAAADVHQELTALMPFDRVHQVALGSKAVIAKPAAYDTAKGRELWQAVARLKVGIEEQRRRERRAAAAGVAELYKVDDELARVGEAYAEAALTEELALSDMRGIAAAARLAAARYGDSEARVDTAAFTIYLKAGYHAAFYRWQDEAKRPTTELSECRALMARAEGGVAFAAQSRHPLPCWRLYELEVLTARPGLPVWQPQLPVASTIITIGEALNNVQAALPSLHRPGAPGSQGEGELAFYIPQ